MKTKTKKSKAAALLVQHIDELISLVPDGRLSDSLPESENQAIGSLWLRDPGAALPMLNRKTAKTWQENALRQRKDKPSTNFPDPKNPKFNFIDLFAGIGGFRLALQAEGGRCRFTSEWDKHAQNTYIQNFGEIPFGDIRLFTSEGVSDNELKRLIPDHDVLAAGFPCQPFSLAGVSSRQSLGIAHGFMCEAQGTLFWDIVRIAHVKKPKVLLLENVKNLASHDKGNTIRIIRDLIEQLGYSFNLQIIDSSSLVPQRRQRCYMVCVRDAGQFTFPINKLKGEPLPLRSILEEKVDDSYTISDRLWKGHVNRTARNLSRGTGFTAQLANLDSPSNTLVARYGKDGKECLIPQRGKNPRMLTPRECARLQGFPEKFQVAEAKTSAYRQFGNSVAVPVVSTIARAIVSQIF